MVKHTEGENNPIKTYDSDTEIYNRYNIGETVTAFNSTVMTNALGVAIVNSAFLLRVNNLAVNMDLTQGFLRLNGHFGVSQLDVNVHQYRQIYRQAQVLDVVNILGQSTKIERLLPSPSSTDFNTYPILNYSGKFDTNEYAEPDINIIRHEDIYHEKKSAFRYNKPMAFVFDHSQLADLNQPQVGGGRGDPGHGGYWKEGDFAKWVKFPDENDLDNQIPNDFENKKRKLLFKSKEYLEAQAAIELLNTGKLTPFMNLAIPDNGKDIPIAKPLEEIPKPLSYNAEYGGHLLVQLGRGQRQQHILASETGRNWIYGGTHTYFTHGRRMIHMDEYSELSNTYNLLVHSSATYHFRCRDKLDYANAESVDVKKAEVTQSINYRYEGDFNIEQVIIDKAAVDTRLQYYNFGIHGRRLTRELLMRAGKISLQYIKNAVDYGKEDAEVNAPKFEVTEKQITIESGAEKNIMLTQEGLVLRHGNFSIEINNSGINFKYGETVKAQLSENLFELLNGVRFINQNTTATNLTAPGITGAGGAFVIADRVSPPQSRSGSPALHRGSATTPALLTTEPTTPANVVKEQINHLNSLTNKNLTPSRK